MSCTINTKKKHFSIIPWISWHEYVVSGRLETLIYEQRTHYYYLLKGVSSVMWHDLLYGNLNNIKTLSSLQLLIEDEIINCDYIKEITWNNSVCEIEKYSKIPDTFLKEIKEEGYVFDAHWDVTNRCNERCIHCYNYKAQSNQRNSVFEELSFDNAQKLIDDLHYIGVFRIVLSGGEVLTKDYFLPICRYIRQLNMQLIVYTNGLAFNKVLLDQFKQLYPDTVCISVYGDSEQSHDNITKTKGSYNKILNVLSSFKESRIETHVKNTLLSENYQVWKTTLKKGIMLADKSLLNCTIYPSLDSKRLTSYVLTEPQLIDFASDEDSPIYYGRKILGSCNIFKDPNDTPCYSVTNNVYVNPAGEVCLCIAFPIVIASLIAGNIKYLKRAPQKKCFQADFEHLSHIEKLDCWRSLKISDLKDCGHYDYCEYCIDVCPGDAFMLTGDLLKAPDNHCIVAKARYKAFLRSQCDNV